MSDALDEFVRMFAEMGEEEKRDFDALLAPELSAPFVPNPGPQTQALHSKADILLYGGGAGGGKSALLIGAAALGHHRAGIFRREGTETEGLIDFAKTMLSERANYNGSDLEFTFKDVDRKIRFGGMKEADGWRKYAGRARDYLGFDEAGEFLEEQVASLIAWNRTAVAGQRTRVILASNPPRGSDGAWLVEWFAPWLDHLYPNPAVPGELRWAIMVGGKTRWVERNEPVVIGTETYLPLSRTFIPALLKDNPYNNTAEYRARISSLPEPLRSQLLYGDFQAGKEDAANQVVPTAWIEAAQARWSKGKPEHAKMLALGVDVAQGGADETVLAPLYGSWFGELIKRKGVDTKDGAAVSALIVQTMRDRCNINVDYTGGWGGGTVTHLTAAGGIDPARINSVVFSGGSNGRTKDGALTFANQRAELWWYFREALDPESGQNVALPPDRRLAAQLAAPTWKLRGESILVESKDDIRKRLGSSTDDADAVILAWYRREPAALMMTQRRPRRDVA